MAFLLQENCATGLQTLPHTFLVSGLIVGVDMLLKVFLAVEVLVFPCLNFIFPISVCLCNARTFVVSNDGKTSFKTLRSLIF